MTGSEALIGLPDARSACSTSTTGLGQPLARHDEVPLDHLSVQPVGDTEARSHLGSSQTGRAPG